MINKLSIQNYKSVKQLDIDCKKVNVFIGEPNTGKSNILEALSFFSPNGTQKETMQEILRFKTLGDLFFDFNYATPIKIVAGDMALDIAFNREKNNLFSATFYDSTKAIPDIGDYNDTALVFGITLRPEGDSFGIRGRGFTPTVRYYHFRRNRIFYTAFQEFLSPPFGTNIPALLVSNPELKKMVSNIFREKGFRLQLKPLENEISISKEVDEELYSYPYYAISETLQRIVFMMLAIESNKNATLVFDEPESNTFPFYTKYIGERIALDETNQYFITTHNPYLLMNIIQKTKMDDLNVFIAHMENYETRVKPLNNAQLGEALDLGPDIFFNLDSLTEE